MGKKVAFHNLGCKVNTYETDIMMKELMGKGFIIVPFDQKADIYIVNTCSVTNIADRKSRQMLHRAKAANPGAIIVAAGCYVNTRGEEEIKAGDADLCVTNEHKKDIAGILEQYLRENGYDKEDVSDICDQKWIPGTHTRCFIKVQDGCDQFCSYCIIPYARGRIRSKPVAEIAEEIREYTGRGYREFIPTGIHISSYGKDRPEDKEDLAKLICHMAQEDGVRRIRLSSLEPRTITEEFVRMLKGTGKLCPHFHLSLQSGSDSVLKRMNRHYTTEEYMQAVSLLRQYFEDPAITTDIITGFPGETDEEFEETLSFVKRVGFYETHVFKYSRRKGTNADRMEGQLPDRVKQERSGVLLEYNKERKRAFEDLYTEKGRRVEVLFEDAEEIGGRVLRTGYTGEYIKVYTDDESCKEGDIAAGFIKRQGKIIIFSESKNGMLS